MHLTLFKSPGDEWVPRLKLQVVLVAAKSLGLLLSERVKKRRTLQQVTYTAGWLCDQRDSSAHWLWRSSHFEPSFNPTAPLEDQASLYCITGVMVWLGHRSDTLCIFLHGELLSRAVMPYFLRMHAQRRC